LRLCYLPLLPQNEDTNNLLLLCPWAWEVWAFFHHDFDPQAYASFTDFEHLEENTEPSLLNLGS
jgi:hypothetical protein